MVSTRIEVSQAQKLRLSVAIAALRRKPAKLSCEDYVLDLRATFRVPNSDSFEDVAGPWRARALDLGTKLHQLEEKYQQEHLELAALRVTSPVVDTAKSPTAPSPIFANKKKLKKRGKPSSSGDGTKEKEHLESKANKTTLVDPPLGPTLTGSFKLCESGNLFATLHALDALVAAHSSDSSPFDTETLFAAALRTLDALADTLSSVLLPNAAVSSSAGVVHSLSTILSRFLTTVLPLFTGTTGSQSTKASPPADDRADTILGRLLFSILVPALRAFIPLSRHHLTVLLAPKNKEKRSPTATGSAAQAIYDLRPDVFDLLRTVFACFGSAIAASPSSNRTLAPSLQAVQHALALEGVRELASLYSPEGAVARDSIPPSDVGETAAPAPLPARGPDRVRRAVEQHARADALWYVCSIVHLTIPGTTSPAEAGALLGEGVCAELAGVLRQARGHAAGGMTGCGRGDRGGCSVMSVVEREMVMAVAEGVWLSQG